MNCEEFQNHITPAVDRHLDSKQTKEFGEHAAACPPCLKEFESEAAVKSAVSTHCPRQSAPPDFKRRILSLVAIEPAPPPGVFRWGSVINLVWFKPTIVFAAACVAVIFFVRQPAGPGDTVSPFSAVNVIDQSLENYNAAVSGKMKPQLVSSNRKELEDYFSGKPGISAKIPAMKSCTLMGGAANDANGVPLAHVLYERGGKIIYMFEMPWETVKKGIQLTVPAEAKASLDSTGWYTASRAGGNAVVLWISGSTLCAVVAPMSDPELMACLLPEEEPARVPAW